MNKKRKSEHTGIPYLSIVMIALYLIGLYMQNTNQFFMLECLYFKPHDLIHGELSRLFTWIMVPSSMHGEAVGLYIARILLVGFAGFILEKVWGRRKYNVFILRGLILTMAAGFLLYFSAYGWADEDVAGDLSSLYISTEFSTIFVLISSLLILGIVLVRKNLRNYKPNFIVGVVCICMYLFMMVYELIQAFLFSASGAWVMVCAIIPSLVNVGISVFTYRGRKKKKSVIEFSEVKGLQLFGKKKFSQKIS